MTDHLNFVLLGLGNGAVFAALAMALVVTYRSSGVLNFGTGALALHAAYTYVYFRNGELLVPIPGLPESIDLGFRLTVPAAVAATLAIEALVGVLLYLLVFRPLRNHAPAAKAVASLGIMVLFTSAMTIQVGGTTIIVKPILADAAWEVGGLRIISGRVWFVVIIVAVAALLGCVYRFTRFGLATRASAETEVGALVTGLSPERIALANWVISAVVAGIAGILIAPLVPLVPGTYTLFIVPALAAAVLGRFSLLAPAVAGGLLIGCLQAEAVFMQNRYDWFPSSGVAEVIPLVMVLLVLVVQGKPLPTRGTLLEQSLGRAPRPHTLWKPLVVVVPVAVVAIYLFDDSYRSALTVSFIFGIISLSLVVVTGYLGQISLAQMTFAGAAGFLLSTLGDDWGIPFPIAPILAALGATVVGVLIGLPALRIRGMLVAVVTLAFAVAVEAVWFRNNDFNGGSSGSPIPNPELFGLDLGIGSGKAFPRPEFALLCLFTLCVIAVGVARLRTSRLGSAMLAVRANERSAAAAGISVVRVKLIGFAMGAFIAGLGGCLLAYKQTNVTFEAFNALLGLALFASVFLAGVTSVSGGLLAGILASGGLAFVFMDRSFDIGRWYGVVSGIGLVLAVTLNPDGAVGPAQAWLDKRRQARLAGAAVGGQPGDVVDRPTPGAAPAPAVGPPILAVDGLHVSYGGVVAVDGVSFDVPECGIVGVIGPNGAGKTTLMDAICGFAGYEGSVVLGGQPLVGLPPHQRARQGLARTFQGVDLYDDLTVEENVMVGQYTADADAEDLTRILSSLGLETWRGRNVRELSQGQRQLVSIARALASRPRILLLDEPAAGLDTTESAWLAERLRAVRANGVTIVLVDHDMRFVLGLCDVIHVLDFGKEIASGTAAEVQASARVSEAYLGSKHTTVAAS